MPYRKGSIAEQLGKMRRVAKRRIASLDKQLSKAETEREKTLIKQQISDLRERIDATYQIKPLTRKATGRSRESLQIAARNLERVNEITRVGAGNVARRNFITKMELNNAEHYGSNKVTKYTKEEVNIFYRATQEAWQGLPPSADRNKAILEYYKDKGIYTGGDLAEFINRVLEINKDVVSRAHRSVERVSDETEVTPDQVEQEPSPIYLVDVMPVTFAFDLENVVNRI